MPKRTQLVSQYLENVSRKALKKYQAIIQEYVGRRHGIYALYKKNRLYYVGLASNLRSRLHRHLHDRHKQSWDMFSVYLIIGSSQLKELESLALRIVIPKGNRVTGKFHKAVNLMRQFRRDVRKALNSELDLLITKKRGLVTKGEKVKEKRKKEGRTPILAKYIKKGFELRARYKGRTIKARVRRDGSISYKGKIYNSPSLAGRAVLKRASNGWKFWKYERAPGDWVRLDELRK